MSSSHRIENHFEIVQEVVPLVHDDHGSEFWSSLGRIMPRLRGPTSGAATDRGEVRVVTNRSSLAGPPEGHHDH